MPGFQARHASELARARFQARQASGLHRRLAAAQPAGTVDLMPDTPDSPPAATGGIVFDDLDERRAARREANPVRGILLGGERFALHPELPAETMHHIKAGDYVAAWRSLLIDPDSTTDPASGHELGIPDHERLAKTIPTVDDLVAVTDLYGADLGKFYASRARSSARGAR